VGIKQVSEEIWLVTFMDYDLGYFDHETCRLEPLANPFGPKLLQASRVEPSRTPREAASERAPIAPKRASGFANLVNDSTRQKCYPCLQYQP